jgi:hypothetical protein
MYIVTISLLIVSFAFDSTGLFMLAGYHAVSEVKRLTILNNWLVMLAFPTTIYIVCSCFHKHLLIDTLLFYWLSFDEEQAIIIIIPSSVVQLAIVTLV